MKKCTYLLAALLFGWQAANALTVEVSNHGEIPAEGMEITIDEAEEDLLTGDKVMKLNGTLLSSGPLSVFINRSAAGLTDEFCCATQCTSGNGGKTEELAFTPSGVAKWYVHYTPAENSYETVTYTFADSADTLTLTVHYANGGEAPVSFPVSFPKKHLIEEFTGQDCGYCPGGMDAVSDFMKNDDRWVLVLHHAGYSDDHFTVAGSKTISSQLGVSGAPSSAINRATTSYYEERTKKSAVVFHPGYLPSVDKAQFDTTTYASIAIANTYDSATRQLTVKVSGLIGSEKLPGDLRLTVLVKESGMIDYQSDYYNTYEGWQEFRHANAVRVFLTNARGDALQPDSATHRYTTEMTTTLNAAWNPENCMVVAFLTEAMKPVVQAEQSPAVAGTKGGADIEHEGIQAVPVADFYPEPDATHGPAFFSGNASEYLPSSSKSYKAYTANGFNYWTIQAYNSDQTVKVNRTNCIPFAQIFLFTKTTEKTIPDGTYEFNLSETPGTAYAGTRDDAQLYIGGSQFYFISKSYFNQNYLVPVAQWLITEGTLTISGDTWKVDAKAMNGAEIHLSNIAEEQAIENINANANANAKAVKFLRDGQLLIEKNNRVYTILGSPVE